MSMYLYHSVCIRKGYSTDCQPWFSAIAVRLQALQLISGGTDRHNFVLPRGGSPNLAYKVRLRLMSSSICASGFRSSTPCVSRMSWSVPGSALPNEMGHPKSAPAAQESHPQGNWSMT